MIWVWAEGIRRVGGTMENILRAKLNSWKSKMEGGSSSSADLYSLL